ncbi:MFS general substrate transporter [Hypoxylon trugodes]|uniref:MFS general substrate transporter n=1 Tax=Hypoxylon trugodes TaxID=326681 RepID=UPI0021A1510F|nr:MFS general substrate transporter [Hypoxylon trugodes]KAI1383284.1 MFS general substrate transporter [Hypoxylon trugodes]
MAKFLRRHHEHDPPIGEIPVPHGPETGDEHQHYPRRHSASYATEHERQIFAHLTHPDDSYTEEGVYWADLPFWKRFSFVNKVNSDESRAEAQGIWAMFKNDPLSPVSWYFRNAVLPGAGLGLEGYVLFSIGNLEPLFDKVWTTCWPKTGTECSTNWVAAVTYLEIVGIMVGQVAVGIIGDWIGRRWGLIQDALVMLLGLLMLTGSWGTTLQGWVIMYAWSLFVYGIGVGGEYPITATSSMENAVSSGRLSTRDDRLHRGRKVTMAFLMQGWGQFVNQVVLIVLLVIFNRGSGDPPYSMTATQYAFRLSFAFPAIGTLWLAYYRTYKMKSASKHLEAAKKKAKVTGYDVQSLKMTFGNFGGRLFATAGGWFCNDVFFYGNKLFQGQFINVISNNPKSIMTTWTWNLVNVVVSLAGYYAASMMIDNKMYGRKTMQQIGFLMCFIMFAVPAFKYDYYTSPAGIHAFQAMYFLSSFFNQFGPNSVTFLVAGEVYPTQVRASAHGFSAMIGKAGALLASVLYNYIGDQTKFYVVPWFGLAGMVITSIWLPDTTGLDLKEQERRWQYILDGRPDEYHGIAIHPQHLSLWEKWTGVGKNYHPDLDLKAKIRDMRADWEEREAARAASDEESATPFDDDDDYTHEIYNYFKGNTSNSVNSLKGEKPRGNGAASPSRSNDAPSDRTLDDPSHEPKPKESASSD